MSTRAKNLDVVATKAIVNGLIAYGWTWDQILSSHTSLIDQLSKHLSNHRYTLDKIRQECTNGPTVLTQSSSVPTSSPPHENALVHTASAGKRKADDGQTQLSKRNRPRAERSVNSNTEAAGLGTGVPAPGLRMMTTTPHSADSLQHLAQEPLDPWMMSTLHNADSLEYFANQQSSRSLHGNI